MAQEIEVDQGVNLTGQTLVERIKEAARLIGIEDVAAMPGYDGLIEIVNIRDGIEHPSASNTYQGGGGRWDEIPLAWMISDRSLKAFGRFLQWINAFMDHLDAARAKLPQQSVQVTVVRGIESLHQTKKPPQ